MSWTTFFQVVLLMFVVAISVSAVVSTAIKEWNKR
jgi:hypothetical protein